MEIISVVVPLAVVYLLVVLAAELQTLCFVAFAFVWYHRFSQSVQNT